MRKRERQLVTIGLIVLFGIIAWWAYAKPNIGGFVDLSKVLKNETTESENYQLAVSNLTATVQENGHVVVSFRIANEDKFNITSVKLLYALNINDPSNATYTESNVTKENETYKAEIPSKFGDVVYYKILIEYENKTFESDVKTIFVKDTQAPVINNITVAYNLTTGNATFTISATDNDAVESVILYYAVNPGNLTNITWTNITLSVSPYNAVIPVQANSTIVFYVEAIDLSGNKARLPGEGYYEFIANETKSLVFQEG